MGAVGAVDGPREDRLREDRPRGTDSTTTLVVVGANPTVAWEAATLPGEVVHVQLPGAPALGPEDRVLTADFLDPSAFRSFTDEVLRPLAPTAVVSLTELGLEPAALAARRLGAAGVDPAVVRATRDKLEMRRVLERRAPHLNPAFAAGDDPEAVARLFAAYGRAVAKPVDGVGSTAIALVEGADALTADRRTAATLLEQFAEGIEFSVEALSAGGRHTVLGIAEKGTTDGFVEVSHMMPPPSLDPRRQELVARAVGELLDALGLTDGPSHTEVMVDGDKIVVIETHTRLGGDGIADLVRLTTGVEWRRAALGWAVGAGITKGPAAAAAAATVFLTAPPGRVTAVAPPPRLAHGDVHAWDLSVLPGDAVHPLRSSSDRLGMAVLTAAGTDACAAAVAELIAHPVVTTAPGPAL
ncbi:ATP-grasp domain-containing protein [Streptomyces sp. H27-S2]|uniref:ATP-grasp domain-containing protein n=1 Tax=Streptomyces antarcticus TaxID=2996458 RepID=UPI00226DB511|nr:ATP-grasp domain-containing protein [Streptomyces sp. H27-S2]MCY0951136.1 ATP-grasp domain-containing protein [Streptomyces sp. H27-S2]